MNLDGTGYNYVVRGLTNVVGLDFDIKTQIIYWSDIGVKKIQRVHISDGLDSGKIEDFIVEDLGIPEDLAIDWTGRKLFWTDANKKIIEVINLDGTQRQALISTGHDKPRAIVVDPVNDKVYWTDWGSEPKILRAKMSDGTQKEVLVNSGLVWPNGLTLDYVDKMLYWADANTDKIEKSYLDGQNRSVLIDRTRVYHPYSLTQFGSRLYWSDWQQHSIEHCNKDAGDDRVSITGGMTRPTALHVYHPDRQPGAGKLSVVSDGKQALVVVLCFKLYVTLLDLVQQITSSFFPENIHTCTCTPPTEGFSWFKNHCPTLRKFQSLFVPSFENLGF